MADASTLPPLLEPFNSLAASMSPPLHALLVENATPTALDTSALLEGLPLGLPPGEPSDASIMPALLDATQCAALSAAVDGQRESMPDTVDGAVDLQLNLSQSELEALIGAERVEAIFAAGRALDVQRGGSGERELPLVEAFVRRYTPDTRPFHPLHQDRAAITVNVALAADDAHGGGRLVSVFSTGARRFERAEGDATVHLSRIVHGVTRMTSGQRYSLIVFLGHEPPVQRRIDPRTGEWTRVVLEP